MLERQKALLILAADFADAFKWRQYFLQFPGVNKLTKNNYGLPYKRHLYPWLFVSGMSIQWDELSVRYLWVRISLVHCLRVPLL